MPSRSHTFWKRFSLCSGTTSWNLGSFSSNTLLKSLQMMWIALQCLLCWCYGYWCEGWLNVTSWIGFMAKTRSLRFYPHSLRFEVLKRKLHTLYIYFRCTSMCQFGCLRSYTDYKYVNDTPAQRKASFFFSMLIMSDTETESCYFCVITYLLLLYGTFGRDFFT